MTSLDHTPARDRESAAWVRELAAGGAVHDAAVARLHDLLLRVARAEVRRRAPRLGIDGPELDDLAHQAAADAAVAILAKLPTFRWESRFTTWAYRFAILEVSAKLARHAWRRPPVRLDGDAWERLPARFGLDPARSAEWRDLVTALRRAVDDDLTDRQRRVFRAIVLDEMPLDALVQELGTTRGAIYKTLFDARRKLRAALVAQGHMHDDEERRP